MRDFAMIFSCPSERVEARSSANSVRSQKSLGSFQRGNDEPAFPSFSKIGLNATKMPKTSQ